MADSLTHRGPDGEGFWISPDKNVGLGHRRLAIIDLSETGKQPMSYANGRYWITYNGEIYNYPELREDLRSRGHRFISMSDTEVLLALFAEKKEKCLEYLDGMFAFAIWDQTEQRLFAARDRFGEKPFYYTQHNETFYFASEMKALWKAGIDRCVSDKMLYNYLAHNFTYNPDDLSETFFKSVVKLKAAHYFYICPGDREVIQRRYWNVDPITVDHDISDHEAETEFRRLFEESVRRRLRSDVPVGSSLSGGLDSSLIVCTIDRLNKQKRIRQATFSARFPGFEKDEGHFMQAVIDSTRVEPHFVFPAGDGLINTLEKLFHHQEEPFGSASIYAQYCVMQLARENKITVLLDGQGADELLAGYHPFFDDYLRELGSANNMIRKREKAAYQAIYGRRDGGPDLRRTIAATLPGPIVRQLKRLRTSLSRFTSSIINSEFHRANADNAFQLWQPADSLQESLHRHTFGGPLEELLRYADRNAMAHSVEVRLPFLSHELTGFLFSLPSQFKIRNGIYKYIMRAAFRDILPPPIANRTDKVGYEPPQNSWLGNTLLKEKIAFSIDLLISRKILRTNAAKTVSSADEGRTIFESYRWRSLMAAHLLDG